MAVGFILSWMTKGIEVNGVLRRDVGSLVMSLLFISLFTSLGLMFLLVARNIRVEADAAEIRIYSLWNKVVFQARWSEIASYGRMPPDTAQKFHSRWRIRAGDRTSRIPLVDDLAELHRIALLHLPDGVLKGEVSLSGDPGPPPIFYETTFGKCRIEADRDRLRYRDREKETEILWDDIRLFESTRVDRGEAGYQQRLMYVTPEKTISVQADFAALRELEALSRQCLPPKAYIFP